MKSIKKLKLKPSSRDNRRYFLADCSENDKIEAAILDYIGVLGFAKSAYLCVSRQGNKILGSCSREHLNNVLASLNFAGIRVTKVSGTIRALSE
jgi:RNase P/RNase MRP subunit POP5